MESYESISNIINFNLESFVIPTLNWKTTKILGVPLLPGLAIEVYPTALKGTVNPLNGKMTLDLEARFCFSFWLLFHAPDLIIKTNLNTESINTSFSKVTGKRIQKDGTVKLVGLAIVPPCGHYYLDRFLGLPNEALAVLNCKINYP
mgnify:CR=1 FL=1